MVSSRVSSSMVLVNDQGTVEQELDGSCDIRNSSGGCASAVQVLASQRVDSIEADPGGQTNPITPSQTATKTRFVIGAVTRVGHSMAGSVDGRGAYGQHEGRVVGTQMATVHSQPYSLSLRLDVTVMKSTRVFICTSGIFLAVTVMKPSLTYLSP
ncbi:hypothetical protein FA13DRAFT_1718328 [Coprinellus micaceus]|uniref:Uncharacterized protein n=1 Tax=Coprinellus micaceus TaxID=71717 RepID=A0A4Y7SE35_COPMI|nr:hypothetical protein FA13DRAFT_1718328 [Coprinellus micaceus]